MNGSLSYRNIWRVAFPIIISGVAQNVVNVTDTAFLGQLSAVALGAAGNAGILYFLIVHSGMGITIGGQIIMGRRNGEGAFLQIGGIFENLIYFLIPLGLVLIIATQLWSDQLLHAIVQSPSIYKAGTAFINYRIFGTCFAFVNFAFIAFYVGITETRVLTFSTLLMMLINVCLDYLLIFGHFGFPKLGIEGAALASVISEGSAVLFFVIYTLLKLDRSKYGMFDFRVPNFLVLRRILDVGSPVVLQHFLALSSWFVFFTIIEKMGEVELAASHIVRSIYMVLMIPLFGFSNATNTLVSNLIGKGQQEQVFKLIWRSMQMALACTAVILLVNLAIPETMIGLFTSDKNLAETARGALQVINFTMFFFCFSFILFNGVTGTGNTWISMFIEFMTISIYLVSAYVIALELKASLPWVWCSEFIYFSLLGALSFGYLKWGNWRQKVI